LESESKLDKIVTKKDKTACLEKAHSGFVLSLDDKVLRHVSNEKTARRL